MAEVLRVSGELEVAEVKSLSIAFITSRKEPKIEWFFDSLKYQLHADEFPTAVVVDALLDSRSLHLDNRWIKTVHCLPKPTIWQGKHRITKEDWWSKSNAMNTAICLCQSDFIAFVDDRCVLVPGWLQCVRDAMEGNYAVCGSYEKRSGMKVENGEIVDYGDLLGVDTRTQWGYPVATKDWYGGSCALPLEWCLAVQGFSENICDGCGYEDSAFGITLGNSGFPMKFDSRMRIIQDRTPGEIEGALKRANKGVHLPPPRPKDWQLLKAFQGKTTSQNSFDIRDMRARILKGEDFRPPSASDRDWYDNQLISEME